MPDPRHNPVLLFLLLLTILSTTAAVILLTQQSPAWAQPLLVDSGTQTPADIIVTSFQITPGHDGLALIDRQNRTICIYQYRTSQAAHERFALVAARSFRYDSMLEDYNNADPTPQKVRQWLLRSQPPDTPAPAVEKKTQTPDVAQPKPGQVDNNQK